MFRVCPRYISILQKQRGVHLEFTATVELFSQYTYYLRESLIKLDIYKYFSISRNNFVAQIIFIQCQQELVAGVLDMCRI